VVGSKFGKGGKRNTIYLDEEKWKERTGGWGGGEGREGCAQEKEGSEKHQSVTDTF